MAIRSAQAVAFSPILGGLFQSLSFGTFRLHESKVAFERYWFNVPLVGPSSFEVQLSDLRLCSVVGSPMLLGCGLALTTDSQKFLLSLSEGIRSSEELCNEWRANIIAAAEGRPLPYDAGTAGGRGW